MEFRKSQQLLKKDELVEFEKKYKLQLPEEYRKSILEHNGGYPEKGFYDGAKVYFRPIKYGVNTVESAIENLQHVLAGDLYPFAEASGVEYCISLKSMNFGAIELFYVHGETEQIADSFTKFLDLLTDEQE
jgi:hypothetical protein